MLPCSPTHPPNRIPIPSPPSPLANARPNNHCANGGRPAGQNFDSGWLKKHGDPDPAKIWADYFVFSTSRNPWARAGSSFDYCPTNWRETKGMCTPPTFEEYCRDPSVLGKLSNL